MGNFILIESKEKKRASPHTYKDVWPEDQKITTAGEDVETPEKGILRPSYWVLHPAGDTGRYILGQSEFDAITHQIGKRSLSS